MSKVFKQFLKKFFFFFLVLFCGLISSWSSEDDAALKDGKLASDISEADQFDGPTGSFLINNGDASTSSNLVSLSLSASDAGMIKAYYVSQKNSTPSTNETGWVTIQEIQHYSATIDHTPWSQYVSFLRKQL